MLNVFVWNGKYLTGPYQVESVDTALDEIARSEGWESHYDACDETGSDPESFEVRLP